VIGDFQEPYRAVLVEGDDIAALPNHREFRGTRSSPASGSE
jgi:hypothetical protein